MYLQNVIQNFDISIVGGGLAGLTASIHLSNLGHSVILFERQAYPHHKVCGEYVSNEVVPYLDSLRVNIPMQDLPTLKRLQLTTQNGKQLNQKLPLGGFGISRFMLDEILYRKAIENGVTIIFQKVENVEFDNNSFQITTNEKQAFSSKICLGTWGKRSQLDKQFSRPFIQKNTSWMAVKCHYESDFEDDLIALHNFQGGYCGMSKVENNILNACYLVDTKVFKKYGNVNLLEKEILMKNPFWAKWRESAKPIFEKPLIISQISFDKKDPIEEHILMAGDSAGLIHPLCGNGMAMAIHAAKLASNAIENYFSTHQDRQQLESEFQDQWRDHFYSRLRAGRQIQSLLLQQNLSPFFIQIANLFPGLVQNIIKKTHGKPITLDA